MPPKTYEEFIDILPDSNPESSTSSAPTTSTNSPPIRISREIGEAEIIKIIHEYLNGRNASVYGWGIINDNGDPAQQLRGVEVTILPNSECEHFYGDVVRDTMLCTSGQGGRGPCGEALSIAQLLKFNCVKHRQKQKKEHLFYWYKETITSRYQVFHIAKKSSATRKRGLLVDKLFSLALSISYDRVLRLSAEIGNRACQMFQTEQVGDSGSPAQLKMKDGRWCQVGVLAFGAKADCSDGYPSGNVLLPIYMDWIEYITGFDFNEYY
ncbi:hypothetical protein Pmani_008805 [Petrolisthes manimaculis]|uniref:Peptidase S1 domain-containing protein n=1 Tax=Petrolisthes manimaculis TaxID=1843537 RepID=A0AAE1UE89_9EUCA|nr:hypothetical protein Pmani_008805 [Petrolisthes manimaculis]